MSYASIKFLLFVLFLMILYYIFPKKHRYVILLLGSIIFYTSLSSSLITFVILATLINYIGARQIEKSSKKKKTIYLITIFLSLAFLLILKYNNFISSIINPIINIVGLNIPYKKFLLPIGISYYTLEMIAYMSDVYRGKCKPENNFLKLLTFFTFFPKIIEGPICRYKDLSETLFNQEKFEYEKFRKAFILIGYGFFKKLVIADRAAIFVDSFMDNGYTGALTIVMMILYTIQIYCDFSGCIDIVTGVAELFAVRLPENFKQPFFSHDIQEFWRRWHMTLGTWLKDYVFFPISLSKMNMKLNQKVRKIKFKHISRFIVIAFPLFFVWFINGLWHGASIKYVVYGLYYYVLMMLGVLLKPILNKITTFLHINTKSFAYKLFEIIRTAVIVCFGMLIFRCDTLTQSFGLITQIFSNISISKLFALGLCKRDFLVLGISVLILFAISLAKEMKIDVRTKLEEKSLPFRWIIYMIIIIGIIIFGVYGRGYSAKSFIYGGF